MYACYNEAPCDTRYTNEKYCGNKYLAIFYFGTFIFLCMFLVSKKYFPSIDSGKTVYLKIDAARVRCKERKLFLAH